MTFALHLPSSQDVYAALNGVVSFLKSRDFAINFIANLGGAMIGVLLAFSIERFRAHRDAKMLYGRVIRTSHSELGYLKPMYKSLSDSLKAGKRAGTPDTGAPATRALLVNPLVHDQAPHSMIMALSVLCYYLDAIEATGEEARNLSLQNQVPFGKILAHQFDSAISIITIVLEQMDSQLDLLGLEKTPDAATQEISRKLHEILRRPLPSIKSEGIMMAKEEGDDPS